MRPRAATEIYSKFISVNPNSGLTGTHIIIPKVFLRNTFDVLSCDAINLVLDLLRCIPPSARNELPSNIFRNSRRTVQAQQQASLELTLGALDLSRGRSSAHSSPFSECEVNKIANVHEVLSNEVDTPQTVVRIRGRESKV